MRLRQIAETLGLEFEGDPALEIIELAGLADAGAQALSFVVGARRRALFDRSKAGAVFAPAGFDVKGRPCLRSPAPYADFARAVELFHPPPARPSPGVHPSAVVAADAVLAADVAIDAYVVVGAGARIGSRSVVHPHVTIYRDVRIGEDCEIHSGVHLREAVRLGDRVVVQSGAVIGSEGFGFAVRPDGSRVRIPHRCAVEIGDDTEIGANSTIDASHPGHSRHGPQAGTRIGRAVKIDNLVQIAHGVEVGDGSTLCAHVALAGGSRLGERVYLGGGAAAKGGVQIADGSLVGGFAGVTRDLPAGSQVLGFPAMDRRLFARVVVAWKRLPELLRRVRRLERRVGLDGED